MWKAWHRNGLAVELEVRRWAWGFGGGVLYEVIHTVVGQRRRVYLGANVLHWQIMLTFWGRMQPPRGL